MEVLAIENLPEVQEAARVLQGLEERGLVEPAIASGWTRAKLTDTTTKDIDVAYVGPVHYEEAQHHLKEVLESLGIDPTPWDIKGIWNAEQAYGVKHTVENYLLYYVCSIDSVYLASDGKLHDPTGFGFADAKDRLLRINNYDHKHGIFPVAREEVNICMEGCRRLAQHGWNATPASVDRIRRGVSAWQELDEEAVAYFKRKLASKFPLQHRPEAQKVYSQLGWGFVFDLIK